MASENPLPFFLSEEDVLAIHARMIELYGGSIGVRDTGMLQSAIAQPCAQFGGQFLHEDLFMMAAAYIFHIAMNHPFIDGNKRAALAAGLAFLDMNGVTMETRELELADMVLEMITEHWDKQWIAAKLRQYARGSK